MDRQPLSGDLDAEVGYTLFASNTTTSMKKKPVSPPADDTSKPGMMVETGAPKASERNSSGSFRDPTEAQVAKLKLECTQQAALAYGLIEKIMECIWMERYHPDQGDLYQLLQQVRAQVSRFLAKAASNERVEVLNIALKALRDEVERLQKINEVAHG